MSQAVSVPAVNQVNASPLVAFWTMALIVGVAALSGILTRPVGALAALWPANAVLLGTLVRFPRLATGHGALGALVGYLSADVLTGSDLATVLWLTGANIAGVVVGFCLFQRLSSRDRSLQTPLSIMYLVGICAAMAASASLASAIGGVVFVGRTFTQELAFWFVTEFVNGLIILPVLLTWGGTRSRRPTALQAAAGPAWMGHGAPLVAVALAMLGGMLLGGPGAMVFALPGLIWCAVSLGLSATAVVTLLSCAWILVGVPLGLIPLGVPIEVTTDTLSFRLGVALLAVAPLTVAGLNEGWNDLNRRLARAAEYDALTGTLSRGAFFQRAERWLAGASEPRDVAVLMCDVDHFKQINDTYGHAAGDAVLIQLAHRLSAGLQAPAMLGRLGGEEFAIVLPDTNAAQAAQTAEVLRQAVAASAVAVPDAPPLRATVSIGVAPDLTGMDLDARLLAADQALYAAKRQGRNCVVMAAAVPA